MKKDKINIVDCILNLTTIKCWCHSENKNSDRFYFRFRITNDNNSLSWIMSLDLMEIDINFRDVQRIKEHIIHSSNICFLDCAMDFDKKFKKNVLDSRSIPYDKQACD